MYRDSTKILVHFENLDKVLSFSSLLNRKYRMVMDQLNTRLGTPISVKFREIRDFSAFTFICEGFQSFIIQQLLYGFCCLLSE